MSLLTASTATGLSTSSTVSSTVHGLNRVQRQIINNTFDTLMANKNSIIYRDLVLPLMNHKGDKTIDWYCLKRCLITNVHRLHIEFLNSSIGFSKSKLRDLKLCPTFGVVGAKKVGALVS